MIIAANSRWHRCWTTLALLTAALPLGAQHPARVPAAHYSVHAIGTSGPDDAIALTVELRLDAPAGDHTVFEIPVWTPGSYRLRDFPDRIEILTATADDRPLAAETVARGAWLVPHGECRSTSIRYRVSLRPNDRFMDPDPARRCITYEGPAVYLYARGQLHRPCHVTFHLPDGWSVAAGLEPRDDGSHFARDYDVLADCPVKLGRFQRHAFTSHDARIEVVLDAVRDINVDLTEWLSGLQAICDAAGDMFGGMPFQRYVFLYTLGRGGGGGLEHLNSTAIGLSLPRFLQSQRSSYGVSAHEFFHVWNVKRLRPLELGPFDYRRPNRTTGLWLSEGVTSYYGPVLQARAGLLPGDAFWRQQAQAIARVESNPGRHHTSPEQASFGVWDIQAPDRDVDYYGAGQVLGLLLDILIRHHTDNQRSLDDAMRTMWRFCEQGNRGLHGHEIVRIVSDTAGTDLGAFFARHVAGTVVPDYAAILAHAGFDCQMEIRPEPVLRGIGVGRSLTFTDWSALETSGRLPASGRLLTLAGEAVTDRNDVQRLVAKAAADGLTRVELTFDDAGTTRTVQADLATRDRVRVALEPNPEATETQRAIAAGMTAPRR